jgi:hypothetical protein
MNSSKYLLVITILGSFIYSQCDYSSEMPCNLNEDCEWVEDIDSTNCGLLSASECSQYFDNGCSLDADCVQWGSWYTWICYEYGPSYCTGGDVYVDNSSCQEIEMPECSDLEEDTCNHPFYGEGCEWIASEVDCEDLNTEYNCNSYDCDWTEDIEYGNCSNYNSSWSCSNANEQCGWTLCYGGGYGEWSYCCTGGTFQTDNSYCEGETSYCEEIQYQLGDINGDSSINILDIIQTIELVLTGDYNHIVDMDSNENINILDIVMLVELIINI